MTVLLWSLYAMGAIFTIVALPYWLGRLGCRDLANPIMVLMTALTWPASLLVFGALYGVSEIVDAASRSGEAKRKRERGR